LALVGEMPAPGIFGIDEFRLERVRSVRAGSAEEAERIKRIVLDTESAALVVDSYEADPRYLEAMKASGVPIAVIDDLNAHELPCDLVISPNVHGESFEYLVPRATRVLAGPRYILLRREFWEQPDSDQVSKGEVLVTLGGSDLHGLMPHLIREIAALPSVTKITAVIGPFFTDLDAVTTEAERVAMEVELRVAPSSLQPNLDRAEIVVSAGGQTLYETAARAKPAVAIETAPNQSGSLDALARAGSAIDAGRAEEPDIAAKVAGEVEKLLTSPVSSRRMADVGRDLIDGRGANRVAAELIEVVEGWTPDG
jgi:spore coat polysaccharide biosynthesis predicted glycosyltransferase SpsG